jgi:hypothetical protein
VVLGVAGVDGQHLAVRLEVAQFVGRDQEILGGSRAPPPVMVRAAVTATAQITPTPVTIFHVAMSASPSRRQRTVRWLMDTAVVRDAARAFERDATEDD